MSYNYEEEIEKLDGKRKAYSYRSCFNSDDLVLKMEYERKAQGLTIKELVADIDVGMVTYYNFINRETAIGIDKVFRILKALGLMINIDRISIRDKERLDIDWLFVENSWQWVIKIIWYKYRRWEKKEMLICQRQKNTQRTQLLNALI